MMAPGDVKVGEAVEVLIEGVVRGQVTRWWRGVVVREASYGSFLIALDDGGMWVALPRELREPRKCCECRALATWTAVPECTSYCEAHGRKVLMLDDREDFADEWATEDRRERELEWA